MSVVSACKQLLRKSRLAYELNGRLKAHLLLTEKVRIDREYQEKLRGQAPDTSQTAVTAMLKGRLERAGISIRRRSAGALRIFCVGTYYEQENSGFLQALRRLGHVMTFENDRGEYGLRSAITYDQAARDSNSRCLLAQVAAAHHEEPIDLVIGTMIAQSIPVECLSSVRSMGIPVVNIAMDDRLPEHWRLNSSFRHGAIGLTEGTDLVLQTTPEYIPRYFAEGCPAIFWPFGSDAELFRPSSLKRFDVVFIGNNYGWRHELIRAIQRANISVAAFGHGFEQGHISASQAAATLAQARIAVGYGYVSYSREITTLKLRDIDGPMSGALYITSSNPDLSRLFDVGTDIETYTDFDDCVRKIKHYLADSRARERIAASGRRRAMRDHTWDARLREAFSTLGVLGS